MVTKTIFVSRPVCLVLAASLSLMLAACATAPGAGNNAAANSAAARSAAAAERARAMQAAALPALEEDSAAVPEASGINREGRILQLGRIAETAPAVAAPTNDTVELNYEQEDLRLVFEQLGSALGINMLIDPTIDNKVSLRTSPSRPMSYNDIWPLMRLLARNAGVSIEQAGAVYEFKRDASNIPVELVQPGSLAAATASIVLQVTPLTYISLDSAEAILKPLLQPEGSIMRLGSANVLGISGSPEQLVRINNLLTVIDDDPFQNQGIQLFELLNSRAADVAEELGSVLQLIEGEQPSYQVLGLDRINAVLVVAPASRGFDEVTRWIRILDAESQEQVEQLFVYRVKNLKAEALGTTLNSVFEKKTSDADATARIERNPVPGAVFQTAPGGGLIVGQASAAQDQQQTDAVSANITVTIVSDEATNSLLIKATPREYRQLLTTISSMDTVTPQVLINAVIGQVTLTDGTRFGIDWTRVSGNLSANRTSSNFLPGTIFNPDTGEPVTGSGLVLTRSFMDGSAIIDATLNAIAEDNEVTLLARPTILATNNKEGSIHVGQSVPVNNGTTVTTAGSTENIAYQNVGIDLKITPQINDDGYISLEIEQALSSVEDGAPGVAGNPTFTDQKIMTSVVVADQTTITLGGLIQEEDSDQQSGIPGLQKIPVMGRLFSYSDLKRSRRELFVILRPQIIFGDERDDALQREFRASFTHVAALLNEAGL